LEDAHFLSLSRPRGTKEVIILKKAWNVFAWNNLPSELLSDPRMDGQGGRPQLTKVGAGRGCAKDTGMS